MGAGLGGLAAAKYLLAETVFTRIVVFDLRPSVSGVWVATPHDRVPTSSEFDIALTVPTTRGNVPVRRDRKLEISGPV